MTIIRNRNRNPQYILDTYPAALAYSMRPLSQRAELIRVRRGSDGAQRDITFSELTDGTLSSFCGASDGFMARWYDLAKDLRPASEPSTADKIYDSTTGLILLNGKPTASSSLLNNSSYPYSFSSLPLTSATVFFVGASGDDLMFLSGDPNRQFRGVANGTQMLFYDGVNIVYSSVFGGSAASQQLFTFVRNDSTKTIDFYRNGVFVGSGASNGVDVNIDRLRQFVGIATDVRVQEAIVFDYAMNSTDRIAIENNINNYYGIY